MNKLISFKSSNCDKGGKYTSDLSFLHMFFFFFFFFFFFYTHIRNVRNERYAYDRCLVEKQKKRKRHILFCDWYFINIYSVFSGYVHSTVKVGMCFPRATRQ